MTKSAPETNADGAEGSAGAAGTEGGALAEGEGGVVETPEQRKQRLKADKAAKIKAARDNAAKDPMVQKQKWLKGAAELITKAQEKAAAAKTIVLPNNMHVTYGDSFDDAVAELRKIRDFLETPCEKSSVKTKLRKAKKFVENLNKDIKAFEQLSTTYGT